ncbi:GNAT family N-acetyltransferase [Dyella subtropica]|uniref:GNAT family N-acetyltransferase n=1 Tax=Dyella subtropica TaxID=2992127 RepID=UPI00225ACF10|nr:GNAT family N-acetyltransferase [Dyella subtropica]
MSRLHAVRLSTDGDAHNGIPPVIAAASVGNAAGLVTSQSKRMRLLGLRFEDIPRLSSLFAQTRMHPLLMESPTRFIDVAAIVACVHRLYASSPGLGVWRAEALDGAFIGLFSLLPVDGSDEVEIHVRLAPEAWGRWYAIEGTYLLCRQAFDVLGLPRLFGYCHPTHLRVRRIMSRFGFRDLGVCEHRHQLAHRYELDASKWRERS